MQYPEQRYLSKLTTIRREVTLPEEATGRVIVREGARVDVRDKVVEGIIPARHVILDAAAFFRLRRLDALEPLLQVEVGDHVDEIQVLAGKNPNRGKRLFSPVRGLIAQIQGGRIIIQQMPQIVDMEAGIRGRVMEIIPGRGVVIEATGAQVQGVWGNGKLGIAPLRIEPDAGIENIYADQLDMKYIGAIIVTRRPITRVTIDIMEEQGLAGLIGPSMAHDLVEVAAASKEPIMITEEFGATRMSRAVLGLLTELDGQAVTLDAYQPRGWESRRPELVVNTSARGQEAPSRPNIMLTLRPGLGVRVTRQPYTGQIGRILDLPKLPVLIENGLRVPCAQVELAGGEVAHIPLANLEVTGR
jgi:hypothetical protein